MVSTDLDLGFEGPVVTTGTVEVMRNEVDGWEGLLEGAEGVPAFAEGSQVVALPAWDAEDVR